MSQKYNGLYLYFDWVDALEKLPPETAMKIIVNLRKFAEKKIEPESLHGPEDLIQNMMLAQLRRSKQAAETAEKVNKRKKAQHYCMISDTVPQEELNRDATPEEALIWERTVRNHCPDEMSEETKRTIERAREAIRVLGIG